MSPTARYTRKDKPKQLYDAKQLTKRSWLIQHSLESKFLLNEVLKLVCASPGGFDQLGVGVDQMVFDKVQAGLNVGILKLDKVQAGCDLLLHRDLIESVARSLLDVRI